MNSARRVKLIDDRVRLISNSMSESGADGVVPDFECLDCCSQHVKKSFADVAARYVARAHDYAAPVRHTYSVLTDRGFQRKGRASNGSYT